MLLGDSQPTSQLVPRPPLPIISSRTLSFPPKFREPRQVWVSNLDTVEDEKLGLIDLHPEVFAYKPRVDIITQNVRWQQLYRHVVSYNYVIRIKFKSLITLLSYSELCNHQSDQRSSGWRT